MALEDSIAKYEVQIIRSGDGASAAVTEFQNLDNAAKKVSSSLSASSEELQKLRETSLLTREGMSGLTDITLLCGGTRFPELQEASMAARGALMSLRTATMLTGASIETMVPVVGIVAAAIAAGVLIWNSYSASMKLAAEQTKAMSDSLAKMPALVTQISGLLKAGLISPDQSQQWMQMLGRTPSNARSAGVLSIDGMNLATPEVPFRPTGK